MITFIQFLIILFALFALSRVILRLKGKEITMSEFILWGLIWLAVIVIAFIPDLVSYVSMRLGIGRGVDLLTYVGLIILFYLVFKIFVLIEKMENDITKISRSIALQNAKKRDKE